MQSGRVRAGDPFDLLTLIIAMACAWSPASGVYTVFIWGDASAPKLAISQDR